jgi:hypothetical protein
MENTLKTIVAALNYIFCAFNLKSLLSSCSVCIPCDLARQLHGYLDGELIEPKFLFAGIRLFRPRSSQHCSLNVMRSPSKQHL